VYKTIVADPPWAYRNTRTGGSMKSGSKQHYEVMSVDEICGVPVSAITEDDSVLFLWSTVPMLEDAFRVMHAWGFEFKTALFWHKMGKLGMGYWFRGNVEVCLVGKRGKFPPFHCQHENFIDARAHDHSQKPREFWELITPFAPTPRLELFCRGDPQPGWDGWGIQCTKSVELNI